MKLKLGDKTFEVKEMTLNQVAELENKGIDLMSFAKQGSFKMSYIRDMVHVLIKDQDPDLTVEWVGRQITMSNFGEVSKKIMDFLTPKGGPAKKAT